MIFNLSQGGVAYLSVTAPSGASITASCQGLELTGTGTCTIEAPIIGTWHIVCVYDDLEKTSDVEIISFGESYTVTFTYTAIIVVTTSPSASVTAAKTGQTSLTGTADANGICNLTVPAGGLGEWSVESSLDGYSSSRTVDVSSYDNSFPVTIILSRPDFTFTVGSTTYTFTDSTETTSTNDYYYYRDANGSNWEFYAKKNGTLNFTSQTAVDLFLLGKGNSGGNGYYNVSSQWSTAEGRYLYWCSKVDGGTGGAGGTRKKHSLVNLEGSVPVSIGTITSIGTYKSNDAGYSQSGSGVNGGYCFDDSAAVGINGNNYLVGAGGGRGGNTMTDGVTPDITPPGNGGIRNGGNGGSSNVGTANNGDNGNYWGAGGGGGAAWGNSSVTYSESGHGGNASGGSGYPGFAAMRNAR